jgi:hypothetical protein
MAQQSAEEKGGYPAKQPDIRLHVEKNAAATVCLIMIVFTFSNCLASSHHGISHTFRRLLD